MIIPTKKAQEAINRDFSLVALKGAIILLGVVFIVLALTINNKWALAGIFAYGALP